MNERKAHRGSVSQRIDRRTFLGAIGAGIVSTAAGCAAHQAQVQQANPSSEKGEVSTALDPSQYADQFESVVDIVEDFEADPTGQESINPALEDAWADDRLIVFPPGQYKMTESFDRTGRRVNAGIIGMNAVIRHGRVDAIHGHRVREGEYHGNVRMFNMGTRPDPLRGKFLFGGFIFDWNWSENAGMQGLHTHVDGELEVRNIQFHGIHSLGCHGNMRVVTMSPSSYGLVDSIDMRWGGKHYENTINTRSTAPRGPRSSWEGNPPSWSTTGIVGDAYLEGTMHINNVLCGGWPGAGMYYQGGGGRKIVTNCVSVNSNVAQIRVSGRDAWEPVDYLDGDDPETSRYAQTTVENCMAGVDHNPDHESYAAQRGIWLRDGWSTVRDCNVVLYDKGHERSSEYGLGILHDVERATVERVRFELHNPVPAIQSSTSGDVSLRHVEIDTVGWDGSRSDLIRGATVQNLKINGERVD